MSMENEVIHAVIFMAAVATVIRAAIWLCEAL